MSFLRRAIFFFLGFGILFHAALQFSITIDFLTHEKEIIEKKCINKDKPEMECNGRCHLKKELKAVSVNIESNSSLEQNNDPIFNWLLLPFSQELLYQKNHQLNDEISIAWLFKEPLSNAHVSIILPPPNLV